MVAIRVVWWDAFDIGLRSSDKEKIRKDQLKESKADKIFFPTVQGIIQLPDTQCISPAFNKRGFPGKR